MEMIFRTSLNLHIARDISDYFLMTQFYIHSRFGLESVGIMCQSQTGNGRVESQKVSSEDKKTA